jgi:hypothetical protein
MFNLKYLFDILAMIDVKNAKFIFGKIGGNVLNLVVKSGRINE